MTSSSRNLTNDARVSSTRAMGRYDDPSRLAVMKEEQTCSFDNFWRALFCFNGPPLPDAELPRNFVDFPTGSQRINSFTMLTHRSGNTEDLTEVSGVDSIHAIPKKVVEVEDPEVIEQKKTDLEEMKSVMNHNTEQRLREVDDNEELLALRRQAAEEEELRKLRKEQLLEQRKQKSLTMENGSGTRPRGFSASLPPPSPRVVPSPRVTDPPSNGIAGPSSISPLSAPHVTHGLRGVDLTIQIDAERPPLYNTLSRSTSSSTKTPRAVPPSPYNRSITSVNFQHVSPHTTGDDVEDTDLSNFAKFACTDGVHCSFYLPTRDGEAKAKPARFLCNTDSNFFRLDILGTSNSPQTSTKNAEVVIKTLNFDTVHDILSIAKGPGPVVLIPKDIPDDLLLHITLHNKPEINLSFSDDTSRNVVYNALPKLFAQMANSVKKPKNTPPSSAVSNLMGLNMSVMKLTSIYWVDVPVRSIYSSKYATKLLLTRSDDVMQVFSLPKDLESHTSVGTPTAATAAANATKAAEIVSKRKAVFDQLSVFMHSKYMTDFLPEKGFESMIEIPFSDVVKVTSVGEGDDHVVEVLYQNIKKEEHELLIRLDGTDKRKSLIVFLEEKRKSCKKTPAGRPDLL